MTNNGDSAGVPISSFVNNQQVTTSKEERVEWFEPKPGDPHQVIRHNINGSVDHGVFIFNKELGKRVFVRNLDIKF